MSPGRGPPAAAARGGLPGGAHTALYRRARRGRGGLSRGHRHRTAPGPRRPRARPGLSQREGALAFGGGTPAEAEAWTGPAAPSARRAAVQGAVTRSRGPGATRRARTCTLGARKGTPLRLPLSRPTTCTLSARSGAYRRALPCTAASKRRATALLCARRALTSPGGAEEESARARGRPCGIAPKPKNRLAIGVETMLLRKESASWSARTPIEKPDTYSRPVQRRKNYGTGVGRRRHLVHPTPSIRPAIRRAARPLTSPFAGPAHPPAASAFLRLSSRIPAS